MKALNALFLSAIVVGCATAPRVEPQAIAPGAIQYRGVVSSASEVPPARALGDVTNTPSMALFGPLVALGAGSASARDETRGINTIVVALSSVLSLSVPVNQTFKSGECVKLFIDPMLKDILARKDVPVMSMPVGSTHVQKDACQ